MSICLLGMDSKLKSSVLEISVPSQRPLVQLANALDWNWLSNLILPDLKRTTQKGFWRVGRKLRLRVHLAIYLLQSYSGKTDRQIEEELQVNAEYQVFCGRTILGKLWHCPDHTKLETFRNRLSPETQNRLNECVVKAAEKLGFADPSVLDQDSTVQEANLAYPSDARLLVKLAEKCKGVLSYLSSQRSRLKLRIPRLLHLDLKKIRKQGLAYFFLSKNSTIEQKREAFEKLFHTVQHEVKPWVRFCSKLKPETLQTLPWNIRQTVIQVRDQTREYLKCVRHFVKTHTLKKGKLLAFHLKEVTCVKKGKLGRPHEFGRVFQLGRIGGNFLMGLCSEKVRPEDKKSVDPMLKRHAQVFGHRKIKSYSTDKGYYSAANVKLAKKAGAVEVEIARPGGHTDETDQEREVRERLHRRRAGIEPLIGHAKRRGLGRSRMKSDRATHASGFRSLIGFNLRQLMRHQAGEVAKMAP
jgi:transposase, IS5 family